MKTAVIGGTGCQGMASHEATRLEVQTPYGTVVVYKREMGTHTIHHLLRHGEGHTVPPHLIDYRANIAALWQLGITQAIGIYAVGSISDTVPPGQIGLIDQFIDFTGGSRNSTFFTGGEAGVRHIPMDEPYNLKLRTKIIEEAAKRHISMAPKGTYVCTNGPRLETPAEIAMFRKWGADHVGMTAATETILANEAGIDFAGIVYSINWAAGIEPQGIGFIEDTVIEQLVVTIDHLAEAALTAH
jgi:purine nucleoside phosphorylase